MEDKNVAYARAPREVARLLVVAPNWLGDAVMALPAITDVRRSWTRSSLTVAARPTIAPLFSLTRDVDGVVPADALAKGAPFDAALLLTNSFRSALSVWRAGVPDRWGYRRELRGLLLTRALSPPTGLHQAGYYQHLVAALGFSNGPLEPALEVSDRNRLAAAALLESSGWDGRRPLVALAPGAAYGGAKRWPASSFAQVATTLAGEGASVVLVGSHADRTAGDDVVASLGSRAPAIDLIDLIGRTDLPTLAGVLAACRTLVSNDSGAAHLAAALGLPVTVLFGPTDERATRPLGRRPPTVLTHRVWCRPCMLRECPLDHRCLLGIAPGPVAAAALRTLDGR